MTSADEYERFARAHLPQPLADRWIGLLRSAVQFPYDMAPGEVPALRVGGDPLLPDGVEWPMLDSYGPLSFIAELDCAAVAAVGGVDLVPRDGYLLFFCADYQSQYPDSSDGVGPWTQGRVLYAAAGAERRARQAPEDVTPYGTAQRPARAVSTPPTTDRAYAERYYGTEMAALMDEDVRALRSSGGRPVESVCPLWAQDFARGIYELRGGYTQTGGHAQSVQGPVALGAAYDALGLPAVIDERVLDEAEHWRVLLQMPDDMDLDMNWGASPVAYWMIRDDDLAARRFDRIWFSMQN